MSVVCFSFGSLLLLATTQLLGGQPSTVFCAIALLAQIFSDVSIKTPAILAPSLFWLALSHATGNRELFFPYTMYLATYVSLLLSGRTFLLGSFGGAIFLVAFFTVRILQHATVRVLAIEFVVAVTILALALVAYSFSSRNTATRAMIVILSSLIAYAGLSI